MNTSIVPGELPPYASHRPSGDRAGVIKQDRAERIEIGAAVEVRVGGGLFRRHVDRRADGDPGAGQPTIGGRGDRAGDPEIGEDRLAIRQQDILGLDVAVHDVAPMGGAECAGRGSGDPDRVGDRQGTVPVEPVTKRFTRHEGHHEVELPFGLAGIVDREDVGVSESRGYFDLAKEALGAEACRHLGSEHFHRDLAPVFEIVREVDRGHPAGPNLVLEAVAVRQRCAETVQRSRHQARVWAQDTAGPQASPSRR
jgi:hypothetical protein